MQYLNRRGGGILFEKGSDGVEISAGVDAVFRSMGFGLWILNMAAHFLSNSESRIKQTSSLIELFFDLVKGKDKVTATENQGVDPFSQDWLDGLLRELIDSLRFVAHLFEKCSSIQKGGE